tara:strand:+ start:394 stop:525 length:132 start_codon:yes stop_codon:yes gene_type:complete
MRVMSMKPARRLVRENLLPEIEKTPQIPIKKTITIALEEEKKA